MCAEWNKIKRAFLWKTETLPSFWFHSFYCANVDDYGANKKSFSWCFAFCVGSYCKYFMKNLTSWKFKIQSSMYLVEILKQICDWTKNWWIVKNYRNFNYLSFHLFARKQYFKVQIISTVGKWKTWIKRKVNKTFSLSMRVQSTRARQAMVAHWVFLLFKQWTGIMIDFRCLLSTIKLPRAATGVSVWIAWFMLHASEHMKASLHFPWRQQQDLPNSSHQDVSQLPLRQILWLH